MVSAAAQSLQGANSAGELEHQPVLRILWIQLEELKEPADAVRHRVAVQAELGGRAAWRAWVIEESLERPDRLAALARPQPIDCLEQVIDHGARSFPRIERQKHAAEPKAEIGKGAVGLLGGARRRSSGACFRGGGPQAADSQVRPSDPAVRHKVGELGFDVRDHSAGGFRYLTDHRLWFSSIGSDQDRG